MSELHKEKFLYMYTGELDADEISAFVRKGIDRYLLSLKDEGKIRKYNFIVNVVEDKDYKKMKFSYAWISDSGLYHVLLGRNEDGTSRVEFIDDPDWEEPDTDTVLTLNSGLNWGETVWDECPQIRKESPPLITIDTYYDEDKEEHTIDFFPAKLPQKSFSKNEIFSKDIPQGITSNFLLNYFKQFCNDNSEHFIKKKKEHVTYPLVKFGTWNGKRNCTIEFSPLDKDLAPFVLSMCKKFRYGHNKKDIIFFSQSKRDR